MRYRLKDRAMQEKLDAISGNDFSKKLNTEAQRTFVGVLGREARRVYFGDFDALTNRFSVILELDEIEEVCEYDPNKWNLWPGVEPPQDVPLRIEVREADKDLDTPEPRFGKIRKKACACFDGFDWYFWPGEPFGARIDIGKGEIVRFRPWVAPYEEENK